MVQIQPTDRHCFPKDAHTDSSREKDIQVQEEEAARLKKASPQAEPILIDKMNHVLKDCESINPQQQMAVYNNPSLPVNTALINAIAEFIKKNK